MTDVAMDCRRRPPGGAGRGARGSPVVLAASPVQETGARRRSSADIQLVALDMDGTLLNSRSVVSPATADAIHAALGKGVMVMLATGEMTFWMHTSERHSIS